jgi:hypothetical protein
MKTKFNLQGSERKPLVKAIEELTGRKGKYTMSGDMKYAFDFGGGLALHRDGTLVDEGNIFGLLTGLAECGFTGETEEAEPKCRDEEETAGGDKADEPDHLTVEFPLDGFNPETLDNLTKMVTAKEALIKAALDADDLPIQVTNDTVKFPWFALADQSHAAYYVQFIFALCKTAKEKKRVTAKERGLADNPKYAMRCWLLSLGLIGDEYKNARKLLLANLGGNSSFKGGSRPTYTAHLYTYPNGSEEDAMDCETTEFTSLAKAKAYCDEFLADCESIKFAGCHVEGDSGDYLYEILTDGTVNEK